MQSLLNGRENMENTTEASPRDFYITSNRAIVQRERMLLVIRWLAFAALLTAFWQLETVTLAGQGLKWFVLILTTTFLYEFEGRELLEDFARREINVTPGSH